MLSFLTVGAACLLNSVQANVIDQPLPDVTEGCNSCKKDLDALQIKWNSTITQEAMLADLKKKCGDEYKVGKAALCRKAVEVLVQIPPGIFEGIDSLAWPISLGLCATMKECHVNCCAPNAAPEQIHLSLAAKDKSLMGVSWVTLDGQDSYVRYGTSEDDLSVSNKGTVLSYDKAGWVGQIHRATMTGLKPATKYYYQVGNQDKHGWSETYYFTTYTPGKEQNFAVIADMAYDEWSDDTVASMTRLIEEGKLDAVIHSGDISYADGYMPHFDNFMNKVQPIAARVPYQVTAGNHEFGYNFTAYKSRFFMPGQIDAGGSGDGMFYSWEYGAIHFDALNTESPIDTGLFTPYQKKWAEADMATIDRSVTPWTVSHFHRPLYCANKADCGKHLMKMGLEDVLMDNKVDLVLVGHVHSYERTKPVYDYTVTEGAPVYIMQGASGNREGNTGSYRPIDEMEDYMASAHTDIGYGILTQSADGKNLKWNFHASAGDNEILDSVTLTKA